MGAAEGASENVRRDTGLGPPPCNCLIRICVFV